MALAFELTSGSGEKYFSAVLGLAISTTTISYLLIFPALGILRFKLPDVPRPYRVPGARWVAVAFSVLTTAWALLATVALLWPGFGTSDPDSALAGPRVRRPAPAVRAVAVHPAAGAGRGRRRLLRAGTRHPPAHGVGAAGHPQRRALPAAATA